MANVLFLMCIKWRYVDGFVLFAALTVASQAISCSQPGFWFGNHYGVAARILTVGAEAFLVHLAAIFRDGYSAHALVIKRQLS